jgi:hypothetical protein
LGVNDSTNFKSKKIIEEYPTFCPKCSKLTSKATHEKKMKYCDSILGLGD